MIYVSSCCLCLIYWSQVLRRELRCNRSSADIWVINDFVAYWDLCSRFDVTIQAQFGSHYRATKAIFIYSLCLAITFFIHSFPYYLIGPWEIWTKFQTGNFRTDFGEWWLKHLLWNFPNMNVTWLHRWSVNIVHCTCVGPTHEGNSNVVTT